mmetsp:Transcript_898/g.1229  ORF Transcript_898/g.1229 Transcript_898/m.1229 type:complete len:113 (-) Transcript_898:106-444(-)
MWTDDCEAMELIEEGFELWSDMNEGDEAYMNVLNKKVAYRMAKNPAKYERLSLAMQAPGAATEEASSSGFDTSTAAAGFAVGFAGFLAVAGMAKMCRAKRTVKQEENTECLL